MRRVRVSLRRRLLHQHEPQLLQVAHEPIGRDPRHDVVGVVDPLPAVVAKLY
jgi:hypothetical protein